MPEESQNEMKQDKLELEAKGQISEEIVSQVIEKIQEEPFLFVIAIVTLLIPLITVASQLGTDDFRLVLWIIATLTLVTIMARYVREVLRSKQDSVTKVNEEEDKTILSESEAKSDMHEPNKALDTLSEDGFTDTLDRNSINKLRHILSEELDIEEFRNLCFDLGISYDGLRGEGLTGKARELVSYAKRHGQLDELVTILRKSRPDIEL